jgi:serine/threonine protein kinase
MKELVSKVEEGTYKVPSDLSKETVSFLNAMLQYDPNRRISANELNKHAFLIKNIKDFTRINTNLIPKKIIFGGEIQINIKENLTIWSIFNEDDEKN